MISQIKHIIEQIPPISLEEMDSVKLLNRTDTKYVFSASKLPKILEEIQDKYSILYINNTPFQSYKTIYFDTQNNDMYLAHQNGWSNRFKIRHRTYLSTQAQYLEIKLKTNKGRTVKKRTKFSIDKDLKEANEFLLKNCPYKGEDLKYRLLVDYTRLTLVDIKNGERATIDIDLRVTDYNTKKQTDFTHVCIVELKRDGNANNSNMQEILKKYRIFQKSMSKYSIGYAATNDTLKKNRFKKKLRYIEKLKK